MKIAVVGSRTFTDYDLLVSILDEYEFDTIVSGGANGADKLGERYAKEKGKKTIIYKPNWHVNGVYRKNAGILRNMDIVNESDLVIAFWDGKSPGTNHTISYTKSKGKECRIVSF